MKMATYSSGSAMATGSDLLIAYCASSAHGILPYYADQKLLGSGSCSAEAPSLKLCYLACILQEGLLLLLLLLYCSTQQTYLESCIAASAAIHTMAAYVKSTSKSTFHDVWKFGTDRLAGKGME